MVSFKRNVVLLVLALFASASAASAEINLSDIWDFITEITDNQSTIIAFIIFAAIVYVVKKFGKGLGSILDLGTGKK